MGLSLIHILGIPEGKLGNRGKGGDCAVAVPVVHRVCAGGKRLSALTSVRCGAGILAIHHVGGDGKDGGGGDSAPVGMVALDETHEGVYQVSCQLVHAVIVISIFREISLYNIVCHNTLLIAHGLNPVSYTHLDVYKRQFFQLALQDAYQGGLAHMQEEPEGTAGGGGIWGGGTPGILGSG